MFFGEGREFLVDADREIEVALFFCVLFLFSADLLIPSVARVSIYAGFFVICSD